MNVDAGELKTFLIDAGLISRQELREAEERAEETGARIDDVLVSDGHLSPDELRRVQASVLGIPFVNLEERKFDLHTLSFIPEPVSRNYNAVAFSEPDTQTIEVALLDTADASRLAFLRKRTGKKVLPRLTDRASIQHALRQYQKMLKEEFGEVIRTECESFGSWAEQENGTSHNTRAVAEDVSTARVVDALLKHALVQNASDIHIEPRENGLLVRYRIDGALYDAMTLPASAAEPIAARIKLLSYLKLDERRMPQDGRFRVETDSENVSVRVSTLPTYYGEKVVLRLLRESAGGFTLEGIGLHGKGLEALHAATREKRGLILTAGPAGSGKTTTLYTILDVFNTPDVNIATIEDPVEYQIPRINQTQIRPDIGFTFAKGLRSILRQDPDIIMAGEVRDAESADIIVNAALTGRMVLSTVNASSAAEAVTALIEQGSDPSHLATALNVVIGQRLVRRLTNDREPHTPSSEEWARLAEHADLDRVLKALKEERYVSADADWEDVQFYKPASSGEYSDGYSGRIGVFEVMRMTPAIREQVAAGADANTLKEQMREENILTHVEDGIFKAAQGITSIEEVLRIISKE